MTPQTQLVTTDLKAERYGDCYRTALASILDLPPAAVPHFFHDRPGYFAGVQRARDWLRLRGLRLFTMPIYGDDITDALRTMADYNPDEFYILIGEAKTGNGHAVIGRGGAIHHDPNPNRPGVKYPLAGDCIFWVHLVVPENVQAASAHLVAAE